MRSFLKGGTLILGGVAAFFLSSCKTTESSSTAEAVEEPEVLVEPMIEADPAGPAAEAMVEQELKELEEALAAEARQRSRRSHWLETQAEKIGAKLSKRPSEQEWELSKNGSNLLLKEESRQAYLNGVMLFLDTPLNKEHGKWGLSDSDERLLLGYLSGVAKESRSIQTIVIDPGHGGSEDGSKNEDQGIVEKDMNLDVALRLQKHLESRGLKVVLTRYDDRLVELKERPKIANAAEADLFVSVHFNAAANKEARGVETYLLTPAGQVSSADESVTADESIPFPGNRFDLENFDLAYRIQESMLDRLKQTDRGVRKARWAVLKGLNCPGVLVEGGFISNESEAMLVGTAGYRERLAAALAEAIARYAASGNS